VADCVRAMARVVSVPVTVKCRIGIDEQDSEVDFQRFIETVADAGCGVFIVHARKAWLSGLSPKENREVPPLDYARVYRLKAARPDLRIVLNGGIETLAACTEHLQHVDGVMLGRAAYQTPYLLADVDRVLFGAEAKPISRSAALEAMLPYVEAHLARGGRLNNITRHILGLYHGERRARVFRRHLSENAVGGSAGVEVLQNAIGLVADRGERRFESAAE
jgi:tRNA-dihydrouridine synthase A